MKQDKTAREQKPKKDKFEQDLTKIFAKALREPDIRQMFDPPKGRK